MFVFLVHADRHMKTIMNSFMLKFPLPTQNIWRMSKFIDMQLASIMCDFLKRHIYIWMQLLTKSDQRTRRALSKNCKLRQSTK